MQIIPQKNYEISGEAIAAIASTLQNFPRSHSHLCEQIERTLSSSLREIPEEEAGASEEAASE